MKFFLQPAIRQDDVHKEFLYLKCCTASHGGMTVNDVARSNHGQFSGTIPRVTSSMCFGIRTLGGNYARAMSLFTNIISFLFYENSLVLVKSLFSLESL